MEYLAGSAELRELYLWQTPFRFPHDEDFWIIGGSIEDPAVMICAKSGNEGVYAVRSYLTVDEVDFAELEPSLNAFLAKLKAA